MESQTELNEKISKITTVIRENYPELSNYLNEIPDTVATETNPEVVNEILSNHYESLLTLFRNYVADHQLQNPNRVYKDHHL